MLILITLTLLITSSVLAQEFNCPYQQGCIYLVDARGAEPKITMLPKTDSRRGKNTVIITGTPESPQNRFYPPPAYQPPPEIQTPILGHYTSIAGHSDHELEMLLEMFRELEYAGYPSVYYHPYYFVEDTYNTGANSCWCRNEWR